LLLSGNRLWHFLDFLGIVTWVMNRGIRGSAIVEKTPPRLTEEPPMLELDRVVKLAAAGKKPGIVVDDEQMEQIVSLFNKVALRDGSISSEETEAMKRYIEGHLQPGSSEMEVEHFLAAFIGGSHLKEGAVMMTRRWFWKVLAACGLGAILPRVGHAQLSDAAKLEFANISDIKTLARVYSNATS